MIRKSYSFGKYYYFIIRALEYGMPDLRGYKVTSWARIFHHFKNKNRYESGILITIYHVGGPWGHPDKSRLI